MRDRGNLSLVPPRTASGEPSRELSDAPSGTTVDTGTDGVKVSSPDAVFTDWLNERIAAMNDAAARLEALARRLRDPAA